MKKMICLALAIGSATSANAAKIVQSAGCDPYMGCTQLASFSSSLGTLNEIEIVWHFSAASYYFVNNLSPELASIKGDTVGALTLYVGPLEAYAAAAATKIVDLDPFAADFPTFIVSSGPSTFKTSDVSGFVDTDWIDLGFRSSIVTTLALPPQDLDVEELHPTRGGPVIWGTVTYDYDAVAAVPEPSSWALMVGGLGLVGAALRGRRRLAAPLR